MVEMLTPRGSMPDVSAQVGSPRWVGADVDATWPRTLDGDAARDVAAALDRVRRAPSIVAAIRLAPQVNRAIEAAAGSTSAELLAPILDAIADEQDTVTAAAAIRALAGVPGDRADGELDRLLAETRLAYASHAAWALEGRGISHGLLRPLARMVARGGLSGMHAQRALARWARQDTSAVLAVLEAVLDDAEDAAARRYLVETVGLVPGRAARLRLERMAEDPWELEDVRVEAIAAFADRLGEPLPASVARLASGSGRLADAARTMRTRRRLQHGVTRHSHASRSGLTVAQIHLAAVMDPDASGAGAGDNGGVATLLSRLGAALVARPSIERVITIGRAPAGAADPAQNILSRTPPGHRFEAVSLEAGEGATFTEAWPALLAAERGIRTALLASGTPDVIHLRMADPGSLAAATVARELGIPIVFTMAPDPHGPIAAAERSGQLDRRSFAAQDAHGALWFRAVLVEHLARSAREVVVFPRPDLQRQMRLLMGIDLAAVPARHTVVPEGVDTHQADVATATVSGGHDATVIGDLDRAIKALPAERHGLPIVVSVGRLHEVKGMARVVEAFAIDADLAARANLVIVGGDLVVPSTAEASELARIEVLFDRYPGLADRVVLLGHRPNAEVSIVLAVARRGWRHAIGAGGAYVCGSLKEEFGLAIVEAMAAGLPVVAPLAGGPATYVDDGVTGALVETSDPSAIAQGIRASLELADRPETALRARRVVQARFTLDRVARTLAAVYRIAAGARILALPMDARPPA